MKKKYSKSLLTITALLLLLVCATSCKNKNNNKFDENTKSSLLSAIQTIDYRVEYSYDTLNRLIKVVEKDLEEVNSSIITDIVYDQFGRISETIYSSIAKENIEKIIDTYTYSGDTIYVKSGSDIDIDTLVVVKDVLKYRKSKHYLTEYLYDAEGNLIQSDEKNINLTFNSKTVYTYNKAETGLINSANTPTWFYVYFTPLEINYSKNLCSSYNNYSIKIEDGTEMEPFSTVNHEIVYKYENGKPISMTNKDITYNETTDYSFEYTTN